MARGGDGYTVDVAQLRACAATWAGRSDRLEDAAGLASGAALGDYEFGFVGGGSAVTESYSSLAASLGRVLREATAQADAIADRVRLAADRYETADDAHARRFDAALDALPTDLADQQ